MSARTMRLRIATAIAVVLREWQCLRATGGLRRLGRQHPAGPTRRLLQRLRERDRNKGHRRCRRQPRQDQGDGRSQQHRMGRRSVDRHVDQAGRRQGILGGPRLHDDRQVGRAGHLCPATGAGQQHVRHDSGVQHQGVRFRQGTEILEGLLEYEGFSRAPGDARCATL